MRVLSKICDLNVLSEFKKYDVHWLQWGVITKECVIKVLSAEFRNKDFLNGKVNEFMKHDLDRDGLVSERPKLFRLLSKTCTNQWWEESHKNGLNGCLIGKSRQS